MTARRWLKIGAGVAVSIVTILGFFQLLAELYGFEITDTIYKFYKDEENAYIMSINI